ncbi:HAMP domain-containing histidine kinase [Ideonella livida]|uniref:HAMP domain-containing histidine kinase n=1 Tax=Ideonella livida TaxID=2707176 RepID=A0A7C9PHD2_9BURK|nr:HAMP domain-containing histidine kinase [Ideonella livida]NDY91976.1 HAMP domain-containing histidine kinase [Ideonella livida]
MNASLSELLENLRQGLLWVGKDGLVRHLNSQAGQLTGLAVGRRVFDPDLARTIAEVVSRQAPKLVNSVGVAAVAGQAPLELACRVIPGLTKDDAFVLIRGGEDDAEGGAAFDNLMMVIKEDLRDPLREAQLSLGVAVDQGDRVAMATLADRLESTLRTLDKLVDLASIWGSEALLSTDRIELWPLLQKVWGEVEPLALDRGITARFRAQGGVQSLSTLYGSEMWLGRVFRECLESAVRGAPKGAQLEIEHRQMGPRALIIFRDCGVFARKPVDAVPMGAAPVAAAAARPGAPRPAATPPAAPAPRRHAREEIGLKLCQHIIALHGGQLREEDEDGLRNFLIDLPTGAPFRTDTSQLDIAQAQQYAKDLAALMARSRKRAAAST